MSAPTEPREPVGPPSSPSEYVAAAYRIADDILFPAASEVDRTGIIPDSHWHALAEAGFFGIAAPADPGAGSAATGPNMPGAGSAASGPNMPGGPDLNLAQIVEINEVLASGCLATAFTWVQHHGVVIALATTSNTALREEFLAATISGRLRAGVALAGVVPTPPRMHATKTADGWRFDGHAPFVSGWTGDATGIELLQISARDVQTDDVIVALIPTNPTPAAVTATPLQLAAADATNTVALTVTALDVSDSQIVSRIPFRDFVASQRTGIRLNGVFPFGLIRRCTALLDAADHPHAARVLRSRADDIRTRMDAALETPPADPTSPLTEDDPLIEARAEAAALAVSATATLVAAQGGPALLRGSDAERLGREAAFTLVAASRPAVKTVLVRQLSDPSS